MLGWEILISRQVPASATDDDQKAALLASWIVGLGGLKWLDELVHKEEAVSYGGNGYPMRYGVTAGVLAQSLATGVPIHGSPTVIGEDYWLPANWTGRARIDLARIRALPADETLTVEAWDQS